MLECDRLLVVANGISHHLGPSYQIRMLFNILSSYGVGMAVDVRGLSLSGTSDSPWRAPVDDGELFTGQEDTPWVLRIPCRSYRTSRRS